MRVRYLLRVSSNQQLDADGDLYAQRRLVLDYIQQQEDWCLDEADTKKEYYEGGVSGYKNSIDKRDVLNQIKEDAKNKEFDILVCYKDDRLGRREYEVPKYIKDLAEYGVLIYTVKDGLITPKNHAESLLSYVRFWHAEGSSLDTSQRVRDNAKELVKKGKFIGGKAPYGYELVFSGELSKHQRALKKLQIVPEKAEVVKTIFSHAIHKNYGFLKIATELNKEERYTTLAPNGYSWKAETVRSILINPIYAGYTAYGRREHNGGAYKKLERDQWVYADSCNEEIKIIELEVWEKVQQIRESRKAKMKEQHEHTGNAPVSTTGTLALIDVLYCGYCGRKMTNGSVYNYWELANGEKKKTRVSKYRCQTKHQAEKCEGKTLYRAEDLEPIVFGVVKEYLTTLEDETRIIEKLKASCQGRERENQNEIKKLKKNLAVVKKDCWTLEENLPKVLRGELPISLDLFEEQIQNNKGKEQELSEKLALLLEDMNDRQGEQQEFEHFIKKIPSWKEVFDQADTATKRVVINKLIEKIDIKRDEIKVRFKISLDEFCSRKSITSGTTQCIHGSV